MTKAIQYTKELIRIPSVSGDEQHCLQYLASWMEAQGLHDITQTNDFVCGYKKGKNANEALILTGHIDTVSEGKIEAWQADPWCAVVEGDKLYGLGGTDMKGGIAAIMAAIESIDMPEVDTWLVAVANEEVDGSGTAAFVRYFSHTYHYASASALIAEPTDLARVEVGHRGNAFVELIFHGQAGHGSQQAGFATSGMGMATAFMAAIDETAVALNDQFKDAIVGSPSIVPTSIQAGDPSSPNKTPDTAKVIVDIRTTPALDRELSPWLTSVGEMYGYEWHYAADPVPSCVCDPPSPIVQKLQRVTGELPTAISHGATDQGCLLAAGIDTVVFGPGEFANAHTQNEWVSAGKINAMTDIIVQLTRHG